MSTSEGQIKFTTCPLDGMAVGCTSPMAHIGLGSLPVILGSPTKFGGRLMSSPSPDEMGTEPVHAAFGQSRPRTVPENMATIPFSSEGLSQSI